LKGLRFFAQHGWHKEEALTGNEFEVNLLATFPAKDNIAPLFDTVDYSELYELVKIIFQEREALLETVAQKIVNAIASEYREVLRLQLNIVKRHPPIATFTGTVGITYIKDFR
jgi:dihydroneopterin aldolase